MSPHSLARCKLKAKAELHASAKSLVPVATSRRSHSSYEGSHDIVDGESPLLLLSLAGVCRRVDGYPDWVCSKRRRNQRVEAR